MGIDFNKIGSVMKIYNAKKVQTPKTVKETASVSNNKDKVQISKEAMDFQTVLKSVKELKNLPDVREDVISPIKEKLDSGTYQVDSRNVAEKILSGSFNKKI